MKISTIRKCMLIPLASMVLVGLASCSSGQPDGPVQNETLFTASLESGRKELFVGETDTFVITPQVSGVTFESTDDSVVSVNADGAVKANKVGKAILTAYINKDTESEYKDSISITVHPESKKATGGYNLSVKSVEDKAKILGKLEKYAMDSHLTGITLFENGGYVKYREKLDDGKQRIVMPTKNYVTGYGFGILSEGDIANPYTYETTNPEHLWYYHTAAAEDPKTINAYNATGSVVGDLFGYVASSYWSIKMNSTKDGTEWYPVLAKDKVNGQPNLFPIPQGSSSTGLYSTWRIYVKTGEDGGLKFRTMSPSKTEYDNIDVELRDYAFAYQLLLTGSSKQKRGAEMAGDTSYGIKGARAFYNRTKNATGEQATTTFNSMVADGSLGIRTNKDANGSYIELDLVNPIDKDTARYTLSSDLVVPVRKEFMESLCHSDDAQKDYVTSVINYYGQFDGSKSPVDTTLCCGAYMLEEWDGTGDSGRIIFKKNTSWDAIEPGRYKIKGVRMKIYTGAKEDENFLYTHFQNDKDLDSVGIPTKYLSQEKGQPSVYATKGDSTFKLNVNSCTQERWNELFGPTGKINKGSQWEVKPWMSNEDFLNGLFFSINRKQFAENRGVQPSLAYFSDAYMTSPSSGVSYNSTAAHKEAIADYLGSDNYGYDYDRAVRSFRAAVNTLVSEGKITLGQDAAHATTIKIHIRWMYQSDIKEYGDDIKKYFEDAFNNDLVCGGLVKLQVEQQAVTNWEEVYNEWLMKGQFDLGFGAISGNTYSPLNFMEVLKSDNSSGFTLNWGADTAKVDTYHPIVYDAQDGEGSRTWSFDSLWEVADHGGVAENGSPVKPVKKCYVANTSISDFSNGVTLQIPCEYVSIPNVTYKTSRAELYIAGYGNFPVTTTIDGNNVTMVISKSEAQQIVQEIREANKMKEGEGDWDKTFTRDRYGWYWSIDITFTMKIGAGQETENYISAGRNSDAPIYA